MIKCQLRPLLEAIVPVLLLIAFPAFGSEPSEFCETLESVNRGDVDTREFPELAGHVKVIAIVMIIALPVCRAAVARRDISVFL